MAIRIRRRRRVVANLRAWDTASISTIEALAA